MKKGKKKTPPRRRRSTKLARGQIVPPSPYALRQKLALLEGRREGEDLPEIDMDRLFNPKLPDGVSLAMAENPIDRMVAWGWITEEMAQAAHHWRRIAWAGFGRPFGHTTDIATEVRGIQPPDYRDKFRMQRLYLDICSQLERRLNRYRMGRLVSIVKEDQDPDPNERDDLAPAFEVLLEVMGRTA